MIDMESNPILFCLRATPFGSVAVLWSVYRGEPKAGRILLDGTGRAACERFYYDNMGAVRKLQRKNLLTMTAQEVENRE